MEKIEFSKVNEIVYKEVLDNGLTIYIYKNPNFQKKYAFFQTNYGSINNEFIPFGKSKYVNMPLGIAHFLEHKLFESNDDENIFEEFEKDGAYVNAATSYEMTYYYFTSVDNFDRNLIRLIDFVQDPHITDENVEKEKGIINQEIDMRCDDSNFYMYQELIYNAFKKSAYKYAIPGTKEEISKITKEDLMNCYNTFYHPSNMCLLIAGDVDVDNIIRLVKENQDKKNYTSMQKIVKRTYKEPEEVSKKEEVIKHNVVNKKVGFAYKIDFKKLNDKEKFKYIFYVSTYLRILFGDTSSFQNDLVKDGVVKSYMEYYSEFFDDENSICLLYFIGDSNNDDKFKELIENKLKEKNNMKEMFDLYKKVFIAGNIRRFESIDSVLSLIKKCVTYYESVLYDYFNIIDEINYDEFIEVISKLNYDNYTKLTLEK